MVKKSPKIDPWGSILIKDYERVVESFNLEKFDDKMLKRFPNPNKLMRRFVAFAGRDLLRIANAIKRKEDFYVLTGIMPSAEKIHLGTRMVVENVSYFQKMGAKTYILVADLEAAATRNISLEEGRKRALEFHIPAYVALGLNPKKTIFYFQSDNEEVKNLAYLFSKNVTLNEFKAIYGKINPGRIISSLTQAGDILFPQLERKMPGIIPVGIDQLPHIQLTRDIVRRVKPDLDFIAPSAIYHKFTPSLDGELKMSKVSPEYCISIPEDPDIAAKKIKNAFTGGRETIKEQRKSGGQPKVCVVYELFVQHLIEDDEKLKKIYEDCKAGKFMCGDCKQVAAELMKKFMTEFNKKIKLAKKKTKHLKFIS